MSLAHPRTFRVIVLCVPGGMYCAFRTNFTRNYALATRVICSGVDADPDSFRSMDPDYECGSDQGE